MERTKRISSQTLAIAILSLLLVASLLMSATGAWFTSSLDDSDTGYTFGTITLGDIDANFVYDLDEQSLDVIMPGDKINVDFDLINAGTADMWVRFQLVIGGTAGESYFTEGYAAQLPEGYVLEGGWVYREAKLVGNRVAGSNEQENVPFEFVVPPTTLDAAEGKTITFSLLVQAVQVANNGDTPQAATWTN